MADLCERLLQILLNVVAQRFQRRDVQNLRVVVELTGESLLEKTIDTGKKGGERFPRSGRRRDQRIRSRLNRRPRLDLYISGLADAGTEPVGDDGVKTGECHRGMLGGVARRVKAGLPLPWHQQREAVRVYRTAKSVTSSPAVSPLFSLVLAPVEANNVLNNSTMFVLS